MLICQFIMERVKIYYKIDEIGNIGLCILCVQLECVCICVCSVMKIAKRRKVENKVEDIQLSYKKS